MFEVTCSILYVGSSSFNETNFCSITFWSLRMRMKQVSKFMNKIWFKLVISLLIFVSWWQLDWPTISSLKLLIISVYLLQFITLLVLRHTLPIVISGAGGYSLTLLMVRLFLVLPHLLFLPLVLFHCWAQWRTTSSCAVCFSCWFWELLGFFYQYMSWLGHLLPFNDGIIFRLAMQSISRFVLNNISSY